MSEDGRTGRGVRGDEGVIGVRGSEGSGGARATLIKPQRDVLLVIYLRGDRGGREGGGNEGERGGAAFWKRGEGYSREEERKRRR